jgi:hypothetical protein
MQAKDTHETIRRYDGAYRGKNHEAIYRRSLKPKERKS